MKVFYEKKELDKTIVYVEKPYSLYFIFIIAIVTSFFEKQLTTLIDLNSTYLFTVVMFLLIFCRLFFMSTMRREIAVARQAGKIKVSGSRFSLFKPLTTEIAK
jgi:hypothetical protein